MRCSSNCSNCELDEDEFLTVDVLKDISIDPVIESTFQPEETCNASNSADSDSSSTSSKNAIIIETADNPSLEVCSISYFAGYLAKKCWDKFGCTDCNLTKNKSNLNDKSILLILFRTYNDIEPTQGLKAPTDEFLDIVTICLHIFEKTFPKIKSEKKILSQLKDKALMQINKKYTHFQNSKCHCHYMYVIELLFRTKIFKECKTENSKIGKRTVQNADKLRVLENK